MKTTIIGLAGGTASGKTTVAREIFNKSKEYGSVTYIRMDDYYKNLSHLTLEERRKINFDHPNAFDVDLLVDHLNKLKNGISINKPIYDFNVSLRSDKTEHIEPSDVVIIEGIMTLQIKEIRELLDIKIFVDTPDDIRFIRRLQRDTTERGRSIDHVINQYLNTVRPMHQSFIEPSKAWADIIIPLGGENKIAIDIINLKLF